jgi:hypothetical protein
MLVMSSWFSGLFSGSSKIENNQFNSEKKVQKKRERLTIISEDKSDHVAQQIAKALLYMEQKLYKSIISSPSLSDEQKRDLLKQTKDNVSKAIHYAKDPIQIELDRFNLGLYSHFRFLIINLKSKPMPILTDTQIANSIGRLSKMMSNVSRIRGNAVARRGESLARSMGAPSAAVSNAEINELMAKAQNRSTLKLTSKAPSAPFGKLSYGGKHKTRRSSSRRQKY